MALKVRGAKISLNSNLFTFKIPPANIVGLVYKTSLIFPAFQSCKFPDDIPFTSVIVKDK